MSSTVAADTCVMYLVRHGATAANRANPPRLQGNKADHPLSEEGRKQAQQTARLLSTYQLHRAFSSPMLRAVETAQAIVASHSLDITTVGQLEEVDVGSWEGQSWEEISQSDPHAYANFMNDPSQWGYRDGENYEQLRQRTFPVIEQLMADHLGQNILLVVHNVVIRVFLASVLQMALSRIRELSQENCAVNVIRYRNGRLKVRSFNSTYHLLD